MNFKLNKISHAKNSRHQEDIMQIQKVARYKELQR